MYLLIFPTVMTTPPPLGESYENVDAAIEFTLPSTLEYEPHKSENLYRSPSALAVQLKKHNNNVMIECDLDMIKPQKNYNICINQLRYDDFDERDDLIRLHLLMNRNFDSD